MAAGENMVLHESFGTLSQLNRLTLPSNLPASALDTIMGLPELEYLSIFLHDDEPEEGLAILWLESTCLTKLDVEGSHFSTLSVRTLSRILAAEVTLYHIREVQPHSTV